MQTFQQTIFDLNNSSYWYPILYLFAAGIILYGMPLKTEYLGGRRVQRWYWFSALLLAFPYILWAGYRTDFIDTRAYIQAYRSTTSFLSDLPSVLAKNSKDQGFSVLMVFCKALGIDQYQHFMLLVAAFQMICMVFIFRKYSEDMWSCLFLFVASTDYMSWMQNGIRQFIAVAMTFAAFDLLVRKRYMSYVAVVLLASTFHGTALLMLPFAFIMTGPAMNRKTTMMIVGVVALIPFIDSVMPLMEDLLANTQYDDMMSNGIWENDDGTNLIRVLVYSVPALAALLGRRYIQHNRDPVINMCINASMITFAKYADSAVTSGIYIGRIPIYTTLYGYMVLPWLIDQIFEKQSGRLIKLLMIGCYVGFYYYQMEIIWGLLSK